MTRVTVNQMPRRPTADEAASFASRLRFLRESRGLGMNKLGREAGLGEGTISLLESGKRGKRTAASTIYAIADALKVSAQWLSEGVSRDGRIFDEDALPGEPEKERLERIERTLAAFAKRLGMKIEYDEPPPDSQSRKRPGNGRK